MGSGKLIRFDTSAAKRDQCRVRSTPLSIISVGRDAEILRLRQEIIGRHSDLQIRSMTPEEAETWVRWAQPHLWVFCHTVELPRLVHLACRIRRFSPRSRLLLLVGSHDPGFEVTLFHQIVRSVDGVESLLDRLSQMAIAV
jgi:hypothetical protein